MDEIKLPNGEIKLIAPQNILYINFIGNISDEDYKEIWQTGVDKAVELNIDKFVFDQSNIGQVSFKARGWVILKMLPKIKKELGSGLKVGVVSAKDLVNKSGVKYLVSMFKKMAGLNVSFFDNYDNAIDSIGNM